MKSTHYKIIFLTISVLSHFVSSSAYTEESVPGEYLIKYSDAISEIHADAISNAVGFVSIESLTDDNILLAKENKKAPLDKKAIKELLAAGIIEIFEPNYIIKINATAPNDSRYSELWGLNNTGGSGGTADVDIDAPEAWDLTRGNSDVVVGVVDTGVLYTHPDLANNMWHNPGEIPSNNIDDDGNGYIDDYYGLNAINPTQAPLDDNGHGSHCSGTIAGTGNNGVGVIGVAHGVKIMALKFINSSGSGSTSDAITAINYAIDMKKAGVNIRVLSNSWGGAGNSSALESAISQASSNGILFVAAAGNEHSNNDTTSSYPANYNLPNVISVAAVDRAGNLASFSNYGITKVHVAAPGVSILSTVLSNAYAVYNGTSMATPHVSGVAALLLSREPSLSVQTLKTRIISSAKPLSSLNGMVQSGGIVSAYRALSSTQTPPSPISSVSYKLKVLTTSNYDETLGTRILNQDDAQYTATLPFSFPFYGTEYPKLAISSNGRLYPLGASDTIDLSQDYNNSVSAGINVLNDDYVAAPTNSNGGVWYKSDSDKVTISWIVTPYAFMNSVNSTTEMIFQSVLYKSGKISFNMKDTYVGNSLYDNGASATCSISPLPDGYGDTYTISNNSANTTYLASEKSLELSLTEKGLYSDFDGDGKSDLIVFRPSTAFWYVLKSSTSYDLNQASSYQWGLAGDTPIIGDFDGDKKADLVVWRPSNGTWYIKSSAQNYDGGSTIQWGMQGDIPITGDVDGDRVSDIIVYRQKTGIFYVLKSSGGFNRAAALSGSQAAVQQIQLGGLANDPVIGDYNGDGADDFVTLWQLIRFWQIKLSNGTFLNSLPWGSPGDTPRACDFNQDGTDDRVVIRINSGNTLDWFAAWTGGGASSFNFGSLGDTPGCRHDYDGDGIPEAIAFRNNAGIWYIRDGRTGNLISHQFGLPGDIPMLN